MKIFCTLALLPFVLLGRVSFAAEAGRITSVLLFPGAATIERTVKVAPGISRVELAGLPANFDPQSIRISPDAGIRVGEVAVQDTGRAQAISAREAEMEAKIQALTDQKGLLDVDAKSAELMRDFLARLGAPAGEGNARSQMPVIDPNSLSGVLEVINRSGRDAFGRLQRVEVQKRELDKQIQALQRDLAKIRSGAKDARAITIHLAKSAGGEMRVSYQVTGASWRPVYRASLDSASSRLELERNAVVSQNTGEDWKGVKIKLATGQPRLAPQGPEPTTWTVAIRPPRPPAPAGAPAARLESRFTAAEVDTLFVGSVAEVQSTFATEFDVPGAIDVPSDGRQVTLHLATQQVSAQQRIRIAPRLDPAAFVTAEAERLEGIWPAGNLQLYRDGNFVGATHWNAQTMEKLRFPFGRDDRIRVVVDQVRNRSGDGGLFGNRAEREVGYSFTVNSFHKSNVELLILDAAPMSSADAIEVRTSFEPKPTAANWENKQGIHAWQQTLKPGATLKLSLGYTITYPKDAAVVGLP